MKKMLLAISILFVSAVVCIPSHARSEDRQKGEGREGWMGDNKALLKDRPLNQVTLLGSHDAATNDLDRGSPVCVGYNLDSGDKLGPFPSKHQLASFKCQTASIKKQLQYGTRYLDLRVASQEGEYWSHHGFLSTRYQGKGGIFAQIRGFLESQPDEVLILNMQHFYCDDHRMTAGEAAVFLQVIKGELKGLLIPEGKPTMKLGEIWAGKGRIILIWSADFEVPDPENIIWDRRVLVDHWWKQKNREVLMDELDGLAVQWSEGRDQEKFKELQAIQSSSKKIKSAVVTNELLEGRIATVWKNAPISIIMVNDVVHSGLMPVLIEKNNLK